MIREPRDNRRKASSRTGKLSRDRWEPEQGRNERGGKRAQVLGVVCSIVHKVAREADMQ